MEDLENGFEYLEYLKKQTRMQLQRYKDFSQYLDDKAREKEVPLHGQFELTPLCNFNCRMCYVHLDQEHLNNRSILPTEVWKDLIHQAWERGMIAATLTGGECLTYPGFEELFLYLHQLGCTVSVLTNGYLLNNRWIAFFKEHMPSSIQITLYGWNDETYERVTGQKAFGTVIHNIKNAIEVGLPIELTVTPTKYLGEDVLNTIKIGKKLTKAFSVNTSLFTPREETGRGNQEDSISMELWYRIYQLLDEENGQTARKISIDRLPPAGGPLHECTECGLRCGGGRSSFVINWKGVMTPCCRMEMICMNAVKAGVSKAWESINQKSNSWPRVPECIDCPYDEVCDNCMGNILQYAKPGEQPLPLCEQTKLLVSHGIKRIPDCE